MTCPFFGKHDSGHGVLIATGGDQCGAIRVAYAPCVLERMGLEPDWLTCPFSCGGTPDEEAPGCIARCVGCGFRSHVCPSPDDCPAEAEGLCPECLRRVEGLAAESAGQQRLFP
jgi:hypothetical protein